MAGGGALAALRSAGHWVGWGFQLQSPPFVLLLSWLFFLLAVQLLGYYEIEWLNPNMGHKLTRKEGLWGSFFTGVLAVVVASPCTAPFMGVALGFALSQSIGLLLAIFFLMGLGLSFPYLLFGLFPSWSRMLPKPGQWMQTLKELMAFPLAAHVRVARLVAGAVERDSCGRTFSYGHGGLVFCTLAAAEEQITLRRSHASRGGFRPYHFAGISRPRRRCDGNQRTRVEAVLRQLNSTAVRARPCS